MICVGWSSASTPHESVTVKRRRTRSVHAFDSTVSSYDTVAGTHDDDTWNVTSPVDDGSVAALSHDVSVACVSDGDEGTRGGGLQIDVPLTRKMNLPSTAKLLMDSRSISAELWLPGREGSDSVPHEDGHASRPRRAAARTGKHVVRIAVEAVEDVVLRARQRRAARVACLHSG